MTFDYTAWINRDPYKPWFTTIPYRNWVGFHHHTVTKPNRLGFITFHCGSPGEKLNLKPQLPPQPMPRFSQLGGALETPASPGTSVVKKASDMSFFKGKLVGGWTNPSEKYARQNGFIFPN